MDIPTDPAFYAVAFTTIFVISFFKGGFGGGFATLGIPFLAFVMSPLDAAIMMAPLVAFMDVFTLNSFRRATWSLPDLRFLIPGLLVGLAIGFFAFVYVDPHLIELVIAAITLIFTIRWFLGGRKIERRTDRRILAQCDAVGRHGRVHDLRGALGRAAIEHLHAAPRPR
ncbi:MAG: sulfite exporter TauE/SafE family protein [Alphaproteobacteria bacterium]|nr:sulfite exporter TauE/SafE family protein [Alphaproteobacteria bacterium]